MGRCGLTASCRADTVRLYIPRPCLPRRVAGDANDCSHSASKSRTQLHTRREFRAPSCTLGGKSGVDARAVEVGRPRDDEVAARGNLVTHEQLEHL